MASTKEAAILEQESTSSESDSLILSTEELFKYLVYYS